MSPNVDGVNRGKFCKENSNLCVDELNLVISEIRPPSQWPLDRAEQIHPCDDGLVHVATLHTSNNTLCRLTVKLIHLPVN